MGCLLLSTYCVGVLSSRTIALACERHVAFMAIVGVARPDFPPICACRKWPLEAVNEVVVLVGRFAGAGGGVQWGNGSTDGTNIQGHASRHQAMSSGYMPKEVARLRAEIEAWVTHADWQDEAEDAA